MAVTIHQTPDSFTPSDNPVVWTFSSDQTAQDNFYFVVKVYINDTLISNEVVFPESGIYARYDASNHCSNYCTLPALGSDLIADAANYCECRITIVERYGTPATDQASTAGTNIVAWKARMTDEDFIAWDSTNYIYGAPGLWLNDLPYTPKVREENESIRLLMINDETSITAFKVELFDSDGVSIVSDTLNFTATSFQLLICNVSPAVIVASALAITTANFEAAEYYEISANAGAGMQTQRIDIDRSLVYSTYKRFHFFSQWGSIDSLSIGLLTRRMGSVQSKGYIRTFGSWNGSSFEFGDQNGRDIDYSKTIEREMKCVTDWLPQAVQNWIIYNFIASPAVWEEDGTDASLIRRAVKNRTIEEKTTENDIIFLEEIMVKLPTYKSAVL